MLTKGKTYEALNVFKKFVIQQSRSRLTKNKKNYSKSLYDSIQGNIDVGANSFSLSFFMEDYGKFQDLGVKGNNPSDVSPNAKIKGQQAPNSPYKFGSGSAKGKWGQFVNGLEKWARKRNVRFRDEQGKYTKGSYKSLAYVIARNIYARGLKPSLFFTKPFEQGFKKLPDELIKAYGLDVEEFLKYTIKQQR